MRSHGHHRVYPGGAMTGDTRRALSHRPTGTSPVVAHPLEKLCLDISHCPTGTSPVVTKQVWISASRRIRMKVRQCYPQIGEIEPCRFFRFFGREIGNRPGFFRFFRPGSNQGNSFSCHHRVYPGGAVTDNQKRPGRTVGHHRACPGGAMTGDARRALTHRPHRDKPGGGGCVGETLPGYQSLSHRDKPGGDKASVDFFASMPPGKCV